MNKTIAALVSAVLLLVAVPVCASTAPATDELVPGKKGELPPTVEKQLDYLFSLAGNPSLGFDQKKIGDILEFSLNGEFDSEELTPAKRNNSRGICLRKNLDTSMDALLKYGYNPNIPSYVTLPSSLRLGGWYPDSDIVKKNVRLWEELDNLSEPLVLWGREFESNTPDQFGGAYYRYDLDRVLVLTKYQDRNVFISVSLQDGESNVGSKAVIINDDDWDYFYSGIEGLDKGLISWMDTFIYGSQSVQIYIESAPGSGKMVSILYKWLKAGWAGANMVEGKHITSGSIRANKCFTTIIESGRLPDVDVFSDNIQKIYKLSDAELDKEIRAYAVAFQEQWGEFTGLKKRSFMKILKDGGYADVLNREQRIAVLVLEYLKMVMGKPVLASLDFLDTPSATHEVAQVQTDQSERAPVTN
ncbi:MAG: hypothetical protein ACNI27_01955 [Desulfovibrio sp.]